MADEKKDDRLEQPEVKREAPPREDKKPNITENPGEGSHMFSDWALI